MEEESKEKILINKYSNLIYRVALAYLRNTEDAEDIVQEVLIKFIRNKKPFDCEEHEKNWIIRVTLNLCYNEANSARLKKNVLVDNAEKFRAKDFENDLVIDIVDRLKDKYKSVFELYYLHDFSSKDISKILKISEMAVRTRLKRARKEIQKELEEGEK